MSEGEQLVLPSKHIIKACESLHDDCGHQGYDKTLALVQQRFFWPRMSVDIADWVDNCGRCLRFKSQPHLAPLVGITTTEPLELVCTDFLKVDAASNGVQYILVITDHFTRYAKAVPCRNMSAKTTAEAILGFIQHFGIPKRLHSDQGANFVGKVIRELCLLLGVEKSRTTSYHPQGNGSCERFNRTLIRMLGTLPADKKRAWPKHIGMLVLAYNATPHDSTGFSPHYLLFGRNARLPVDNLFPREACPKQVDEVREALEWAWAKASELDSQKKSKAKTYYDRRVRGATLEPGDRVLVKEVAFDGPHKLADKWSKEIYTVVQQPKQDIPVFRVKPIDGGRERTLHRNLLLPVQIVRDPTLPSNAPVQLTEPSHKKVPCVEAEEGPEVMVERYEDHSSDNDSDEEEELLTTAFPRQSVPMHPPGIIDEPPVPTSPIVRAPPTPAPRRSNRLRQAPTWQTSGDFAMGSAVEVLMALLSHEGIDRQIVTQAITDLVTQRSGSSFT